MNKSNRIGTRLRELRKIKNETQEDLAKVLCKSPKTIGHYETGTRKPSEDDLKLICEHYGVNFDYFKDSDSFDMTEIQGVISKVANNPDAVRAFWVAAFPIVQNRSGTSDPDFLEGLDIHQAIFSEIVDNITAVLRIDSLERAINYYQKAADKGVDEAKINIVSILIFIYCNSNGEQLNITKEIIKRYEIDDLKKECLNYVIERAQEITNKEKVETIDPAVMELLLDVTSDRFRDIREFYLAARYYWGLTQDCRQDISQSVGFEMMYILALAGNELAANFVLAYIDMRKTIKSD